MKIGILGTGSMAGALGRKWASAGHEVFIGGRDPDRAMALADEIGRGARHGTFTQAAGSAPVLLLAVLNTAVFDVLASVGDLRGKTIIDCNNPFDAETGLVQNEFQSRSMAEAIADAAPGTNVVKAYNTIPAAVLEKNPPQVGPQKTSVFLCGDDANARSLIAQLSRDAMLDPIDCGSLDRARLVEAMATLTINLIFGGMGANVAMNLAR